MAKSRSRGARTPGTDKGGRGSSTSSNSSGSAKGAGKGLMSSGSMRETVESIVIAVILAFLFRTFEAEAFVIPTGSMAPTLQGRHMDVVCPQCQHRYRTGASGENPENAGRNYVIGTTCPMCQFTQTLKRNQDPNHESFTGDRILVNKFVYSVFEPTRWDIIVFKYPGNAKINFIKRLVGLPEEVLRIRHGDVYTLPYSELTDAERKMLQDPEISSIKKREMVADIPVSRFTIARKPPRKLRAILQLVHDSDHIAPKLRKVGFPSRWQELKTPEAKAVWKNEYSDEGKARYTAAAGSTRDAMLRYRHLPPRKRPQTPDGAPSDWERIYAPGGPSKAELAEFNARRGGLITDFYAYNAARTVTGLDPRVYDPTESYWDDPAAPARGMHWVGDLAVEANVELQGDKGELILDLVEAGTHYQCRIDAATGEATLSIVKDGKEQPFTDGKGTNLHPKAATAVRGGGAYHVRLANVDNQVTLWVNNSVVEFDSSTTYNPAGPARPQWTKDDPLDAAPVGIGVKGIGAVVSQVRVLRDIYYVAQQQALDPVTGNFDLRGTTLSGVMNTVGDYESTRVGPNDILDIMQDPDQWSATTDKNRLDDIFAPGVRRSVDFWMNEDQFFPMGDNSPASKDARLWGEKVGNPPANPEPFVDRKLLTGKALLIYWPHHWNSPVPFTPNFERMGLIR